jgi:DNA repair exonuclease SbcCD ATPase subunit
MRLKSVILRNYRLHRELSLQLDPSRTLIGGPNESGKSTIVEAIHRALFLKAKGNTEYHRAMVSSLHPGHPEVELTFEAGGSEYVLKKRFAVSGTSTLTSIKSGLLSGDAAESELARLLGVETGVSGKAVGGQWGHLWTWQGKAGDDPSAHATAQRDGLLQRLQAMGGAAALQSELDARVAAHFSEAVGLLFTQAGKPKAGSELEQAESAANIAGDEATAAAARVERLASAAEDLENAARIFEAAAKSLEDLERDRELTETKVLQLAELRQKEAEQCREAKDAGDRLRTVQSADSQILEARADIARLERKLEPLNASMSRLASEREEAKERAYKGEQFYRTAIEATRVARLRHELACAYFVLFEKTEAQRKLSERQEKVSRRQRELRELEEQRAKLPEVDKARLNKIQKLEAACSNARTALQAMATGFEVLASNQPVEASGRPLRIAEKEILTEDTEISIGSAIRLRIVPGGGTSLADARKEEADAQRKLQECLDSIGLQSVQDAIEVAARRDDLDSKIKTAQAELEGMGAENVADELQTAQNEVASTQSNVERLAALATVQIPPADKAAAKSLSKELESSLRKAEEQESEAKGDRDRFADALEGADAALAARRSETEQERNTLNGLKAQLDLLLKTHGDDDARGRTLIERGVARTKTESLLKSTIHAIGALQPELVEGDRMRIARAIKVRTSERDDARTQIAVAKSALTSDGHEDPMEALAAARANARSAEEHRASVRRKADALALLDQLFNDEQRSLAEQFTQPLADKISGYLQCIFGVGASAHVNLENNEFAGLRLTRSDAGGGSYAFDTLSGGAKEQTAAAVRLAMAEVLAADHGGSLPLVFDDAFAYSDPQRVNQLQRMLDRAAARGLQVIVLTCNPSDYVALGAQQIVVCPRSIAIEHADCR